MSNGKAARPAASAQPDGRLKRFVWALTRKKPLDDRTETNLNRCLNLVDLTALGVGSTLGLGLYVLAGQTASKKAGPAVVISFALAALASAFSAICYAEFAGRVPKAGSAYAYSYITVGEFVAFIIGWNLVLEYVIGASSVARAFSGYLRLVYEHVQDTFWKGELSNTADLPMLAANQTLVTAANGSLAIVGTTNRALRLARSALEAPLASTAAAAAAASLDNAAATPLRSIWDAITDYVWHYFDWVTIVIVIVLTCFILFGVKESTNVTLIFTAVNISVVLVVVLSSLKSLKWHNWQLTKEELPSDEYGEGGFMPYGWAGVMAGSAGCFFAFIGFDTIASSAEEAKNPKRNVPLSILLSLFISFLAYMSMSTVQTLLWPYYDQNNNTILPRIFSQLNMPVTSCIVMAGAIAGLSSSLLGGLYPLPRILYSMAKDKLIYNSLAHINGRLKLPVRATVVGSMFIILLACLLDIEALADMVSIGTLAAYSLVSLSVLIIRYEDRSDDVIDEPSRSQNGGSLNFLESVRVDRDNNGATCKLDEVLNKGEWIDTREQATNKGESMIINKWKPVQPEMMTRAKPTKASGNKSKKYICIIIILIILLNILAKHAMSNKNSNFEHHLMSIRNVSIAACVFIGLALVAVMLLLAKLPTCLDDKSNDMFTVPMVPLIPTLSILVNTSLMLNLSLLTWIRFTVWMALGFFIYFSYGIRRSEGYYLKTNVATPQIDNENKIHA